jgi:hypothetical protein
LFSKVNEEIPLRASTQQGVTERLEDVLPALEGWDAINYQTNQPTNQ